VKKTSSFGGRLAMARFGRVLAALSLGLSFLQPAVLAGGAPSYRQLPVINGRITLDEYEELPYNQTLARCTALDCKALKSIVRSLEFLIRRYFPTTMATIVPPQLPRGPVPIIRDVARHPELRAPSCKLLTILAKNYFDWSVGLLTVELASLISSGHRHCLKETVSALPQNKETRHMVEYAQELCVVRHEPNCSAISFQ